MVHTPWNERNSLCDHLVIHMFSFDLSLYYSKSDVISSWVTLCLVITYDGGVHNVSFIVLQNVLYHFEDHEQWPWWMLLINLPPPFIVCCLFKCWLSLHDHMTTICACPDVVMHYPCVIVPLWMFYAWWGYWWMFQSSPLNWTTCL